MREFIEREKLLSELRISAEHHVQNSREESLLYRDRNIVREQPKVTEQEIVKPYFEKLKQVMKERDEDNGGEPLNAVDKGYNLAFEHMCLEIDKILSEQEKEK